MVLEFKSIRTLVDKDPTEDHRHPGGRRKYITRGELEGRRLWQRVNSSHSIGAKLLEELTTTEQLVEQLRSSSASYNELAPVISSFALVEEAALLYAPKIERGKPDLRGDLYKEVRVPFTDINNVGRTVSGVGRTKRTPFHGDGCDCWICRPDLEKNK